MQHVKLVHNSGTIIEFDAEEAEFYAGAQEDENGVPNPKAGMLTGYKINSGERMPVFWTRLDTIDLVTVTNID